MTVDGQGRMRLGWSARPPPFPLRARRETVEKRTHLALVDGGADVVEHAHGRARVEAAAVLEGLVVPGRQPGRVREEEGGR